MSAFRPVHLMHRHTIRWSLLNARKTKKKVSNFLGLLRIFHTSSLASSALTSLRIEKRKIVEKGEICYSLVFVSNFVGSTRFQLNEWWLCTLIHLFYAHNELNKTEKKRPIYSVVYEHELTVITYAMRYIARANLWPKNRNENKIRIWFLLLNSDQQQHQRNGL